jgi:TrmH family RNA methyltransferase
MKYISSHSNPFYKGLLKLASSARQRRKVQQTLLEGAHLLQAYHAYANQRPQHLLVTEAAMQNREVVELLDKFPDVPLSQLDDSLFTELSGKTPSCILALELLEFQLHVQSSFVCC